METGHAIDRTLARHRDLWTGAFLLIAWNLLATSTAAIWIARPLANCSVKWRAARRRQCACADPSDRLAVSH
jgi:hypothetical protein